MELERLIQKARELCKAATPGPWSIDTITGDIEDYGDENKIISRGIDGADGVGLNTGVEYQMYSEPDAALIAAAPALLMELANELEASRSLTGRLLSTQLQALADAYDKGRRHCEDEDDK